MKKIRRKSIQYAKNNLGYSLIEVLIALSIFSIGVLAIAAMQTTAQLGNRNAGDSTEATTCGMAMMERLISLSYSDSNLAEGTYTPAASSDGIDNDFDGHQH